MKKIYVLILIFVATFVMAGCEKKTEEKATDSQNDTTEKEDKITTVRCSMEMDEEEVKQTLIVDLTGRNDILKEMKLTGEMENGTWEMNFKDGIPVNIKMHMVDTENSEDYAYFNDLSEENKKQMLELMASVVKDELVAEYSELKDYVQYIDINFNVENNNLIMDINIDAEKIGYELLQKTDLLSDINLDDFNIDGVDLDALDKEDLDIDEEVKELENKGFVCEKSV